jgi:hypothetical protein
MKKMGEMADYTLSLQMDNDDWSARPFRKQKPKFVVCNRCGIGGLVWFNIYDSNKGKRVWRLHNHPINSLHKCKE